MISDQDVQNKISKATRDVLRLSRNTLIVNLRFLDAAISRLQPVPVDGITYATDGQHLRYGPKHVLRRFKVEAEQTTRDYLHIVLHCVFSHMFVSTLIDKELWNLACDIAVENTITDLGLRAIETSSQTKQASEISMLKSKVNMLTAEKIYAYYRDINLSINEIIRLKELFEVDDHSVWYGESQPFGGTGGEHDSDQRQSDDSNEQHQEEPGEELNNDENGQDSGDSEQNESNTISRTELMEDWKNISERIQQDLETFSKEQGTGAGGMMQNLASVNREKYDYTSFLKKFAVLGEAMVINDEEFDYIFYTYGLKLYKNMPLIEPLEYKEVKRIKEFVIAIDTSGSTSGALVQRFVQKTYNILKSTESFFSKINVHIIQCDAAIQEHVKITTEEEFDEYLETMKIYGLGGTDFRPVFSFVDELIEAKEFSNLKGLIYFTDGWGTFPSYKPDYETAFVFLDNDYHNPEVPPWAIKLVLQDDEI